MNVAKVLPFGFAAVLFSAGAQPATVNNVDPAERRSSSLWQFSKRRGSSHEIRNRLFPRFCSGPQCWFGPATKSLCGISYHSMHWCSYWYRPDYYEMLKMAGVVEARNPQGPDSSDSPGDDQSQWVQRGGSFLCTDQYCTRDMLGTRGKGDNDSGGQ